MFSSDTLIRAKAESVSGIIKYYNITPRANFKYYT